MLMEQSEIWNMEWGVGNRECGMRICRVAWRFLILALTMICAESVNLSRSPFPTHYSHKIHVSVMNLEFDRPKQTVEIVIRVFTDDLENALGRRAKQAM